MNTEKEALTDDQQEFLAKLALAGILTWSALGAYSGYKLFNKWVDRKERQAIAKQADLEWKLYLAQTKEN